MDFLRPAQGDGQSVDALVKVEAIRDGYHLMIAGVVVRFFDRFHEAQASLMRDDIRKAMAQKLQLTLPLKNK